jgi:predicted phage terminase large subunit-like protein
VHFSPESGDKDYRALPFAAQVAAGMVHLMPGSWNATFLSEAAAFGPGAAYKDQIDACSRAYAMLVREVTPDIALAAPTLIVAG